MEAPGFLWRGIALDAADFPLSERERQRYLAATQRVDRSGCLTRDDDRTQLDWRRMTSLHVLEVCLFRAAAETGTPEDIRLILLRSGFAAADMRANVHLGRGRKDGTVVQGTLAIDEVPWRLRGFLDLWLAHNLSVSILLDADGRPFHAQAVINRT